MTRLSVAIITYNEEEKIQDCLESIKWADEIVVVDSFSTDKTLDICRQYTDKVFQHEWSGFSYQKNHAIDVTTNPWVLILDADERVSEGLRKEIKEVLEKDFGVDGYFMPRKSYFLGRWIRYGGWYPDYSIRLFRKDRGRFEQREVHESIRIDGKTGKLKNPLEHFTYRNLSEYIQRMDRYATLAAIEMNGEGRRSGPGNILFRPILTFFRMYILQQGFREGIYGLLLSVLYSYYTFVKYAKLW
ncbi:MAG: glycosyltransferase family 2 protein, partial [Nitrospirae bacterium]|nr:glycosyltransferase family 2 protein [Nitrospirota bacterium]